MEGREKNEKEKSGKRRTAKKSGEFLLYSKLIIIAKGSVFNFLYWLHHKHQSLTDSL